MSQQGRHDETIRKLRLMFILHYEMAERERKSF